jgi:peroxiredoxin
MNCRFYRLSILTICFAALSILVGANRVQGQDDRSQAELKVQAEKTSAAAEETEALVAEKDDSKKELVQGADKESESNEDQPNEDQSDDLETSLKEVLEGHSEHGDAFNEGPRQKAYLMGGTGNVSFPVTTDSKDAQAFIDQGIGQLHGFWFLEAERSFRQAAALDPDCAMAYWGAALATYTKRERAQGFIKKAAEIRDDQKDKITERETMYIDALKEYFSDDVKDKKKRAQSYLKALESIVIKYPDDVEAKALVAHRVWQNARDGIPISSYVSLSSLIDDILEIEPLHPAHHYTIHLWDRRHPSNAVKAAARCGVAAPSIAHMWHMPGHIYSRLKRYEDAVYQQEASARVDHAHMMRDRVMPDEISNFAHNNEWLIRNLIFIGRVDDAIKLAKNMIELPQHPKYNTLEKKSGSASYGRRRLLQVLREYQMWDQAIDLCQSAYLDVPGDPAEQIKTLRLLGSACAMTGKTELLANSKSRLDGLETDSKNEKRELELKIARLKVALDKGKDAPPVAEMEKVDPKKGKVHLKEAKEKLAKVDRRIKDINKAKDGIEGYELVSQNDFKSAAEKLEGAAAEDLSWIAELQFAGGDSKGGLEKATKQVERRPKEVIPLARLAYLQYQNGDNDLAMETFEKLRDASTSMQSELELFQRLKPIADELQIAGDWRKTRKRPADLGFQPPLDSLGPFRWTPSAAPKWILKDALDSPASSKEYLGEPVVVIFYLGHGCLHCAEQLHAFAPRVDDFEEQGIKMIAISSDDHEGLQKSIEVFDGEMPIRLAADGDLEVFKKYRCFDDFENKPLHGTFLIDAKGMVRWQDISYEPFMEHQFLLDEAKRLLADESPEIAKSRSKDSKTDEDKNVTAGNQSKAKQAKPSREKTDQKVTSGKKAPASETTASSSSE